MRVSLNFESSWWNLKIADLGKTLWGFNLFMFRFLDVSRTTTLEENCPLTLTLTLTLTGGHFSSGVIVQIPFSIFHLKQYCTSLFHVKRHSIYLMMGKGSLNVLTRFYIHLWLLQEYAYRILKKCHYVKSIRIRSFFWSVFSCLRTEYGDLLRKSPYSVRTE